MKDRSIKLEDVRDAVEAGCSQCGSCAQLCPFLKEYGDPSEIVARTRTLPIEAWPNPFECSMCGLCTMVCPANLQLDDLILSMRRAQMASCLVDLNTYRPIMTYENIGKTSLFSFFKLPEGGDTVLFPGCALPATRPKTVQRLFSVLRESDPSIGIVLDCCLKPSHDLGREAYFDEHFNVLLDKMTQAGVRRVLTACPNCQKVFNRYGGPIEAETVYNVFAENNISPDCKHDGSGVIHDPCPIRFDTTTQESVRTLASRCNITLEKAKGQGRFTRCCGEGGMVSFIKPEFAEHWTASRQETAAGRRMITSCAGCTNILGRTIETSHILDLFLGTHKVKPLTAPWTYPARLKLKFWLMRHA